MKNKPTKEYRCECGKLLDGTQYFNRETKKWQCGKCYLKQNENNSKKEV